MQTKIVFVGGTIGGTHGTSVDTFAHENMPPVVGRQRRRGRARADVVQGGPGDDRASTINTALTAANAAGGQGTPAGDAAFEASLVSRFNTNYNSTVDDVLEHRAVEPDVGDR